MFSGKIKLRTSEDFVQSSDLTSHLADYVFENTPKVFYTLHERHELFPYVHFMALCIAQHLGEDAMLNYEQNTSDAMSIFHKLQTGLDVNVRFTR